jgi:hypothetical protein
VWVADYCRPLPLAALATVEGLPLPGVVALALLAGSLVVVAPSLSILLSLLVLSLILLMLLALLFLLALMALLLLPGLLLLLTLLTASSPGGPALLAVPLDPSLRLVPSATLLWAARPLSAPLDALSVRPGVAALLAVLVGLAPLLSSSASLAPAPLPVLLAALGLLPALLLVTVLGFASFGLFAELIALNRTENFLHLALALVFLGSDSASAHAETVPDRTHSNGRRRHQAPERRASGPPNAFRAPFDGRTPRSGVQTWR